MIYPGESSSVSQEESAPEGEPRLRLEDGVKEDAAELGCRNWTVSPPNATTCSYELSWFPSWLWR